MNVYDDQNFNCHIWTFWQEELTKRRLKLVFFCWQCFHLCTYLHFHIWSRVVRFCCYYFLRDAQKVKHTITEWVFSTSLHFKPKLTWKTGHPHLSFFLAFQVLEYFSWCSLSTKVTDSLLESNLLWECLPLWLLIELTLPSYETIVPIEC